jgi:hypothetical protein
MNSITQLTCTCGEVQLHAEKAPIISTECHCNSCRAAGARLQTLGAPAAIVKANGGTPFVLYRKDRVRFVSGAERLKAFRLRPEATTRRVVATCCNMPIFLEFKGGHWLSLYAGLWPKGTLPPLDLRTMTSDRPESVALDEDVPSGKRQTLAFYAKLLGAWIAMGFRSPKIPVNGEVGA